MFLHNRPVSGDTTKQSGDAGEDAALRHLVAQGLRLIARNYRTPGRGGGEIDLIMQDARGTTVFIEVRKRRRTGAAASVNRTKQRRIIFAAKHYLMHQPVWPPCRFDVVALDGDALTWVQGAFDADA